MIVWPEPVERVAACLRGAGVEARLEEFQVATSTAADAARAIGCRPSQIVKSLVFACSGSLVLVLVPGHRRADAAKIAAAAGAADARPAPPEAVAAATGFPAGGVAPFPPGAVARVFAERTVLAQRLVWVGAGSPRHMAAVSSHDLVRLARAQLLDLVAQE